MALTEQPLLQAGSASIVLPCPTLPGPALPGPALQISHEHCDSHCNAGAQEVVMLDREAIALQCSLLSAQACGLDSVEDHMLHPSPLADTSKQEQQSHEQGQPHKYRDVANPGSSHDVTARPQVNAPVLSSLVQGIQCSTLVSMLCDHDIADTASCILPHAAAALAFAVRRCAELFCSDHCILCPSYAQHACTLCCAVLCCAVLC